MSNDEVKQAPFNMALNTLESIRDWIDDIAKLSVGIVSGINVDPNNQIILKHRMVKQLIMLSTPLLTERYLKEIEDFFSEIKISKGKIRVGNTWKHGVDIYTQDADYELDECVQGIEKALQESGHFMPSADESVLF